jgi:hypothetical protein
MNQPPAGGGPRVPPGRFTVRLTVAGEAGGQPWTASQPLVVRPDPRLARDGVTVAVLREQYLHNLRVRDLVADVNRLVERVQAARTRLAGAAAAGDTLSKVQALEATLLTPPVRYSRPGLQAQVQYLYGLTSQSDQKVGRDAVERYQTLRREVDAAAAEAARWLGASR